MNQARSFVMDDQRGRFERVKTAIRFQDEKRAERNVRRRRSVRLTVLALLIAVLDSPR